MSEPKVEVTMMRGTVILTVTSFIVKILSAVYRVPFQNLVGDEGFYVYQQVYPIYGIAMTLALTGLPVYFSKMIAAEKSELKRGELMKMFLVVVTGLSLIAFLVLYFGAKGISRAMGDASLAPLLKIVSMMFLLVPGLSTYRGFYQGQLQMKPTAISQLIEQGVRVAVILAAGGAYLSYGLTLYQMGSLATAGSLVGGVAGLGILFLYGRKPKLPRVSWRHVPKASWRPFTRRLLREGGTLCFFSAYLVLFQLIDSFVVKQALEFGGLTELEAKMAKGVFDRGQPLVQLGVVVAIAMTASFLPLLTKYYVMKEDQAYEQTVHSYFKVSLVIGSAASIGLSAVLPYINVTLFEDNSGEVTLSVFVLSVFLVSMIQTYQTIYQSQNLVRRQFISALVGLSVKGIMSPILTIYLGTVGSSISTLLGLAVCWGLLRFYLFRHQARLKIEKGYLLKVMKSLVVMSVLLLVYREVMSQLSWMSYGRVMSLLITLLGVVLGFTSYLLCVIHYQLFNDAEWMMVPFGKKIVKKMNKTNDK